MTNIYGKIISLILLTSFYNFGLAQKQERDILDVQAQKWVTDSLIQVLQKQKEDSNRAEPLLSLASIYSLSQPDTCILLGIQALEIFKKLNNQKGVGTSLYTIGDGFRIIGNYPKALEAAINALKIFEQTDDTVKVIRAYNFMGVIYRDQGNYQEALNNLYKGKALNELLYDKTLRDFHNSAFFSNIGETYRYLNLLDSARINLQHALNLAYQHKNTRNLGWFLFEMAYVHSEAEEYPLALEHFRMSIPNRIRFNDYLGLCKAYRGIAFVFDKIGQTDSGFYYARKAVSIAQQKVLLHEMLKASDYLSSLYERDNNKDSALFYIKLTKLTTDSLFNQQHLSQMQSLSFDEKLRQIEKEERERKAEEERAHNLQFAAIALGLVTFIISFLLFSHSVIANPKIIKYLGILSLLIVFEFLNLFIHPFLAQLTHHQPLFLLIVMVCMATLLIPLHHKMEHWVTHKLVEKNNRIRLAAAKKTIAELENNHPQVHLQDSQDAQK